MPFAFSTDGLSPPEFIRNAGRAVKEGNLSRRRVARADGERRGSFAGVSEPARRTIEEGQDRQSVVTEGDLLDGGRIRHVFVDGRPVDTDVPAAPASGRGGGWRL